MTTNTQTTTIDDAAIPGEIDGLIQSRKDWDVGTRKASLEERNKLLGRCLDLYKAISGSTKLQRALNDYLKNHHITFNSGTSMSLKLLRAVFMDPADTKEPPQRLYEYRRVLESASKAGISGDDLPAFIEQNGGTDGIRRQTKDGESPKDTRSKLIDRAERVYEALPAKNVTATGIKPTKPVSRVEASNLSVGVLRVEADGTVSIVATSGNKSDLNSILARAGKEITDEQVEMLKRHIDDQQAREKAEESAAFEKALGSTVLAA